MNDSLASLALSLPPLALIAAAAIPSRWANRHAATVRRAVTAVAGLSCLMSLVMAVGVAANAGWFPGNSSPSPSPTFAGPELPFHVSLLCDGVSALMLALVSFVGWIICRYSIRFLDGEPGQGNYFRWTSFTIGSVSLMILSGNLLLFWICWVLTSMGLHQLLVHYGHRPAAKRAAWTKFSVSRIGDAALLAAIMILFKEFGTLEFSKLFAAVADLSGASPAVHAANLLLVMGAVTKSAQFPFHTWLPQTLETPTPVSALMHAGIVNAGGYLIIRTSPLVSLSPLTLTGLALLGATTACVAAVIMLTQTSVKKSLAYSTIAQMGFMMLQCGLGAFSAAMLHLLAHSLYKAAAFLRSGSVLTDAAAQAAPASRRSVLTARQCLLSGVLVVTFLAVAFEIFGIDLRTKPGGLLLSAVLAIGLWQWVGQALTKGSPAVLIRVLAASAALSVAYAVGFVTVDKIVASSLPSAAAPALGWLVAAVVTAGFTTAFLVQTQMLGRLPSRWSNAFYVHASNGFYLENAIRRVFGSIATQ